MHHGAAFPGGPSSISLGPTRHHNDKRMRRSDLGDLLERGARCFVRPVPVLEEQNRRPFARVKRDDGCQRIEHRGLQVLSLKVSRQRVLRARY